jgi:D-sedoheptulose 7-phosphate isomerase
LNPLNEIDEAIRLCGWLREHEAEFRTIEGLSGRLEACLNRGGRILTCGNGGSLCDATHLAEELAGRYRRDRPALPAQAINDAAFLTCVANDSGFELVFARGVEAWGRRGDVLVVFSTSGRSPNVVRAAQRARELGLEVIGLLGHDGGRLKDLCDAALIVPGTTADRIQEIHIKVVHLLIGELERRLFPDVAS